jgi:hypothetical protein
MLSSVTKSQINRLLGAKGEDYDLYHAMVMYSPTHHIVKTVEKKGARYIYKVTVNAPSSSVTFSGQADQSVTMTLDEICKMLT